MLPLKEKSEQFLVTLNHFLKLFNYEIKNITLILIHLLIFQSCKSSYKKWNVPENLNNKDLVIVRRFNTNILKINNLEVSDFDISDIRDFAITAGKYKLRIQPEMWISSFPYDENFLTESKEIEFTAEKGKTVYICLGISKNLEWHPFTIQVNTGQNPVDILLKEMNSRDAGCFSNNKMIPVSWLSE